MFKTLIKHIMNGLTYVIPLLMLSGLFVLFESWTLFNLSVYTPIKEALWFAVLPVFSAFMMHSMVDRPGIIPGIVIGILAHLFHFGFGGVLVITLITGVSLKQLIPRFKNVMMSIKSLISIVLLPMIAVILSIGTAYLWSLTMNPVGLWFQNLSFHFVFLSVLGVVLAALMAFDLGGPINKIAYFIAITSILNNQPSIMMAAVMVGGMTPPLAVALTSFVKPRVFSKDLKKKAAQNWINGFAFLTEGAIIFLEPIPIYRRIAFMIGSGIAGLTVVLLGVETLLPHGGIFFVWATNNWVGFILALLLGTFVSSLLLFKTTPVNGNAINR